MKVNMPSLLIYLGCAAVLHVIIVNGLGLYQGRYLSKTGQFLAHLVGSKLHAAGLAAILAGSLVLWSDETFLSSTWSIVLATMLGVIDVVLTARAMRTLR